MNVFGEWGSYFVVICPRCGIENIYKELPNPEHTMTCDGAECSQQFQVLERPADDH